MSTSLRLAAILALVAACTLTLSSCSRATTQAGGLELIITTAGVRPGTDFDTLEVVVQQETSPGTWHQLFDTPQRVPTDVTLPTTVSIQAGKSADQDALIEVTGLKNGAPVVQRIVQVQIPTNRVAELVVVLAADCVGKVAQCSSGSCQPGTGSCGSNVVDPSTLPTYAPGDEGRIDAGSGGDADGMEAAIHEASVEASVPTYTVGGTVSGLTGTVTLKNEDGSTLTVSQNGAFTFPTAVPNGTMFTVTVLTQPAAEICVAHNGAGTVASADVTSIQVVCDATIADGGAEAAGPVVIGGTLSGLAAGASVTLEDNLGDPLTLMQDGPFTFATPLAAGGTYAVTVLAQPAGQTCTVTGGMGIASGSDVSTVVVACTSVFTIGGTVSGLAAGTTVTLQDNGGDDLTLNANGAFVFVTPVPDGAAYAVTVLTQPTGPSQTCTVVGGVGAVAGASVTNVTVACTPSGFAIGGTLTGLGASNSVVLVDNGGDALTLAMNGTFMFATPVANGATYAVTIQMQPSGQLCSASAGSGTVSGTAVTSVVVNCASSSFTIGGTVSGLAAGGSLALKNNGSDPIFVSTNGSFSFDQTLASGAAYDVTVAANPTTPVDQTCNVSGGSGTVGASNVTSVMIVCMASSFTVGGTLSGYFGTNPLVLQNNGASDLTLTANGTFTFSTPLPSGTMYSVTVETQPGSGEACAITSGTGTGTVGTANVTQVQVTCSCPSGQCCTAPQACTGMFGCPGERACSGGLLQACAATPPCQCAPNSTQSCTVNGGCGGSQTCGSNFTWGACTQITSGCSNGATQPCGNCGTQTCSCGAWGACTGQGICSAGSNQACTATYESYIFGSCSNPGSQACAANCSGYGACNASPEAFAVNGATGYGVNAAAFNSYGSGPNCFGSTNNYGPWQVCPTGSTIASASCTMNVGQFGVDGSCSVYMQGSDTAGISVHANNNCTVSASGYLNISCVPASCTSAP